MGARLVIVGQAGGSNVGASLRRAADAELGPEPVVFLDVYSAHRGPAALRALAWRLRDRRPVRQRAFVRSVIETCARERPDFLVATGAILTEGSLAALRRLGIRTLNYSTDDPWNPTSRSEWHLRALPHFDVVATPRDNAGDLKSIGCRRVEVVPFAYDEGLVAVEGPLPAGPDVLFVGGADADRVAFLSEFAARLPTAVVGGYWSRERIPGVTDLGHQAPNTVAALTAAAKVNLCLVRRANRDGHVMRTYEMAATGAAMVVEDTADHRALFGPEGEAVLYFRTAADAEANARRLLGDEVLRLRLRAAAQRRVRSGGNTYRDRLRTMLAFLAEAESRQAASTA
ncbi:MAG: glycosyltransferase [Bauldia sp.]|nr:glycosyltransferase [Bauldia sp.]